MNFWLKQKINITRAVIILVSWMVVNFGFELYKLTFVSMENQSVIWQDFILKHTVAGGLAGIVGGLFLVYFNAYFFRKTSYRTALLVTGIVYCTGFACIWTIASRLPRSDYPPELLNDLFSVSNLDNFVFWGGLVFCTAFLLQMGDKFGPGILAQFIIGKYHSPRQTSKIFMFLDMKDSTSIAEKLGHKKYFQLLGTCFSDITTPVISCQGEIYQYVGDGIVLTWDMEKGLKNQNCIRCFFDIQHQFQRHTDRYTVRFGLVPEFKAGLHCGDVTAGEIGQIKRDIIYSGDVLNTTARIQDQCKVLNKQVLVSSLLAKKISPCDAYEFIPKGDTRLSGKHKPVTLFAVAPLG